MNDPVPLSTNDLNDLKKIFAECFREDHYYTALSSNNTDELFQSFEEVFQYCLAHKWAYGIRENKELIGFLIFFDYLQTLQNPAEIDRIFGTSEEEKANLKKIQSQIPPGKTIYLLSIGVPESFRRKGYASRMLDTLIQSYPEYNIVSDVSNMKSIPMYMKRDFRTYSLESDYMLVVKERSNTK